MSPALNMDILAIYTENSHESAILPGSANSLDLRSLCLLKLNRVNYNISGLNWSLVVQIDENKLEKARKRFCFILCISVLSMYHVLA